MGPPERKFWRVLSLSGVVVPGATADGVELDHLDSGEKIPPPAARPRRRDRLLDIGRIRRGCSPGEAAFVRLLVRHRIDLAVAAAEVKIPVFLAQKTRKTTAVDLATKNWLE